MGLYISSMKMHLSRAAFAAILIAAPAFAEDAPVKPAVALDYKIYIGGLEALSATATIGSDAAHYDIEITAVTAGAVGRSRSSMPRPTTSRARTARWCCTMMGMAASSTAR
jgi:hypothetical protein